MALALFTCPLGATVSSTLTTPTTFIFFASSGYAGLTFCLGVRPSAKASPLRLNMSVATRSTGAIFRRFEFNIVSPDHQLLNIKIRSLVVTNSLGQVDVANIMQVKLKSGKLL